MPLLAALVVAWCGLFAGDAHAQETLPPPTPTCEPASTCSEAKVTPEAAAAQENEDAAASPPAPVVQKDAEAVEPKLSALRLFALAGGSSLVTALVLQGGAAATSLVVAGALSLLTLPSSLDANGGSCLALVCLATPFHGCMMLAGSAASLGAGAVAAWAATSVVGKRRTALVPAWLGMHIPVVTAVLGAAVLQWVLTFTNCYCTVCGSLCFASFLVSTYGWPNQNAEYYANRRAAPLIFFSMFALTQLAVAAVSLGGSGLASAMAGLWAANTGRQLYVGESAFPPDFFWVSDKPAAPAPAPPPSPAPKPPADDDEEDLEEEE